MCCTPNGQFTTACDDCKEEIANERSLTKSYLKSINYPCAFVGKWEQLKLNYAHIFLSNYVLYVLYIKFKVQHVYSYLIVRIENYRSKYTQTI